MSETDEKKAKEQVEEAEKTIEKSPKFWMKGSDGVRSASLTLAVIAFVVCTLWVVASAFEKIGSVAIRPFDPAVAGVYLAPSLALYWSRRHTAAVKENGSKAQK